MKSARALATPAGQLLAFVAGAAVCLIAGIGAGSAVIGVLGGVRNDVGMALASGAISALLLLLSAHLLRRQSAPLATLGLPRTGRRMRELVWGFVVSAVLFLAVAGVQSMIVGAPWEFQGIRGFGAALGGLALAMSMVLAEELLFRGMGLRALRALYGDRGAIVLSAGVFGAYHLLGSGNWAMGAVFLFLTSASGGLLFGWAAVRSGGLGLPIGLHLGGNWVQASIAGFSPLASPAAPVPPLALWRIPISASDLQLLTAPDLLPRLPFLAALVLAGAITWQILRVHPNRVGGTL